MRIRQGPFRFARQAVVRPAFILLVFVAAASSAAGGSFDAAHAAPPGTGSNAPASPMAPITDNAVSWPSWEQIGRVVSLRDTRIVVLGTMLLGAAAGVVGTFAYLRKRALMGDALSHATLPGIAAVFLIMGSKHFSWLLLGAAVTGVLGVLTVIGLRRVSRLKEDAAIGIVLSVFFGAGMVLFSLVQQMRTGDEAGLQTFIYGKAAALTLRDARLIGLTGTLVVIGAALLFKEFRLVCFDEAFAGARGYSVPLLDILMMTLVVLTTVIGLQAVGLIMIVALLIIPAAAARFWTDGLLPMTLLAGIIGAASGLFGAGISALLPRMPTGAIIVITAGVLFTISMVAAPRRGLIASLFRRIRLRTRVAHQHLMRTFAELEEMRGAHARVAFSELSRMRSWTMAELQLLLLWARAKGFIVADDKGAIGLTDDGRSEAEHVLRNHRLWEMYLIRYADIAPSHVDRDADEVEHVLSPALIRELEDAIAHEGIPPSPHTLEVNP